MSWLRDHFHNFVFPAFMAAEKRSDEIGEPFDVRPSPHAPERLPTELKKLWTLCKEHNVPWAYDVREVNIHGGTSHFRETAKIHHKILRATLDSAVVALRDEKCDRLLLGGRDTWTFAVLCEKRRIPYLFVPELSRAVADRPEIKDFLASRGFTGRELFLDTGFAGSIPKCLANHYGRIPFAFRLMSQSDQLSVKSSIMTDLDPMLGKGHRKIQERIKRKPNQLFPNRQNARSEAVETEYLAKYWRTGTFWNKGKIPGDPEFEIGKVEIVQYFADKRSIQRAALLTSQLWRGIPFWRTCQEPKYPTYSFNGYQQSEGPGHVGMMDPHSLVVSNSSSNINTINTLTGSGTIGTTTFLLNGNMMNQVAPIGLPTTMVEHLAKFKHDPNLNMTETEYEALKELESKQLISQAPDELQEVATITTTTPV